MIPVNPNSNERTVEQTAKRDAPALSGVSPVQPASELRPDVLAHRIAELEQPLRDAFAARCAVLASTSQPDDLADPEALRTIFDAHVRALDFVDDPEPVARDLSRLVAPRFGDDTLAKNVGRAGAAFDWALRDVLGEAYGATAAAHVREGSTLLHRLTQRVARHRTGEFLAVPKPPRTDPASAGDA